MKSRDMELLANPTKENLEEIWNTKPHGWYKSMKKAHSKLKEFNVIITPIIYTELPVEKLKVFASNRDDAFTMAKQIVKEKHPDIKIDSYRYGFS